MSITEKMLENFVTRLNTQRGGEYYILDHAHGGVRLEYTKGRGDVLDSGYTTKRNLYNLMVAYAQGLRDSNG